MVPIDAVRWLLLLPLMGTTVAGTAAQTDPPARVLHEQLLTLDTHLDTPANFARAGWSILERHNFANDRSQVDLPRMIEGGLDGGFWVIFTQQGPLTDQGHQAARDAALLTALRIREMIAENRQQFELALTAADAARIAARGRRVSYMSIENGYPLGHDPTLLKTFYDLGVRLFGPVHFRNNDLGDSATDSTRKWNGLSPLGKQLVVEANRLGIVLDASHASDEVLDQMLTLSRTPLLLSHSGCKEVFNHPRNVDDARLRKLAAAGGVIQINSLSGYLISVPANPERERAFAALNAQFDPAANLSAQQSAEPAKARRALEQKYPQPRATFDDFMNHVLHALKLLGPDHVGIGADWDGGGGVTGMDDVSALPKITERLLSAGYTREQIQKIWSGNVLRVLRKAEEYAASVR